MYMKKLFFFLFSVTLSSALALSQEHIHPSHWYVGLKDPKLQIMIHRDRVAAEKITMQPYPGVKDRKSVV